jgi:oxygen-independent coproporphyrinogen-3 oxidase
MGVDLIYGVPGQSVTRWLDTLNRIISFGPEHVSCYQLTLEHGTPLEKMAAEGRIRLPSEEEASDFFLTTSQALEDAGYIHYEVSNFARNEKSMSRHNQKYWHHVPYLGLGPSSHSFDGKTRWWNCSSVERYCAALEKGGSAMEGFEDLTDEQIRLEAVGLGLRTKGGIDAKELPNDSNTAKVLSQLENSGFVSLENSRIVPTRKGFLVADHLPTALL